jgi:5-(hydroxymethyl)furfural/furfural oxidase
MNGSFEDGFAPVPISHDRATRSSTATGYLPLAVRRRANLTVMAEAEVERILFDGRRATGVTVRRGNETLLLSADHVVVCAGGLRSPWLLLKSGIGPASHVSESGIKPLVDRPGVGGNLQDHPTVSIVAYTAPSGRRKAFRHNYVNLVYSSGISGAPAGDMVMSVICKTAWHALGDRLGALSTYVGKPFSRGKLGLNPGNPSAGPSVNFNWLSDERDVDRASESFRLMATILRSPQVSPAVQEIFAAGFSPKVKKVGALTTYNRFLTTLAGLTMDASSFLRHQIIRNVAADGPTVDELLADERMRKGYLRATTTGIWHPCGTCRMGSSADPMAVVDPSGSVIGVENLTVADASIMPEIPTTNLNIPTVMVAEHIADILKRQ